MVLECRNQMDRQIVRVHCTQFEICLPKPLCKNKKNLNPSKKIKKTIFLRLLFRLLATNQIKC